MHFPSIRHCLVCEEVRPELMGKSSILGFYGVTPNVNLIVQDLTKPIERLSFLLICEPGEGNHKVIVRIEGPNGETVFTAPEADFSFPPSQQPVNVVIGIAPVQFPTTGRYRFVLVVNGDERFHTFFEIQHAGISKASQ
jgi:hypothetical protein